jgi:hypothetical protein
MVTLPLHLLRTKTKGENYWVMATLYFCSLTDYTIQEIVFPVNHNFQAASKRENTCFSPNNRKGLVKENDFLYNLLNPLVPLIEKHLCP